MFTGTLAAGLWPFASRAGATGLFFEFAIEVAAWIPRSFASFKNEGLESGLV
jgi:hypothetical protein